MIRNSILTVLAVAVLGIFLNAQQDAEVVSLTQTPGEFEQTELTLKAGETYRFEVLNS